MSGVVTDRVRHKTGLLPVESRFVRAVLESKASGHVGDELGDWCPRSLIKRDIDSRAGDECQAARLDEAHTVVFPLYRSLVHVVLRVLWETGSQFIKVTLDLHSRSYHRGGICGEMDRLLPHNYGEPIGRNLAADGKELARTVLEDALPNLKKGMQDGNEDIFVDGKQGQLGKTLCTPRDNISQGFKYRETCVTNGCCHGVHVRTEEATCGEILRGFGNRPLLCKVLEETQRGTPLVQDLGEH